MLGIGMPGPMEWVIILGFLAALLFGIGLLVRVSRSGGPPPGPRGFDVEPRRKDQDDK